MQPLKTVIRHNWHYAVGAFLGLDGFLELIESIKFLFIEKPELEHALLTGTLQQYEVTEVTNMAIIVMVQTVISLMVSAHIFKKKEELAEHVSGIFGLLVILGNNLVTRYLELHGAGELLQDAVVPLITKLFSFGS